MESGEDCGFAAEWRVKSEENQKRGRREQACLFRFEPLNVIPYSDFIKNRRNCSYPGTVKTVPYELTDLLRVKF